MTWCFQIHPADNVATLLADIVEPGVAGILGGSTGSLEVRENVPFGHKVAVSRIAAGDAIVKYGAAIGVATREIEPGEWVHLHNCRSRVDEKSSQLDVQTGARTETVYE